MDSRLWACLLLNDGRTLAAGQGRPGLGRALPLFGQEAYNSTAAVLCRASQSREGGSAACRTQLAQTKFLCVFLGPPRAPHHTTGHEARPLTRQGPHTNAHTHTCCAAPPTRTPTCPVARSSVLLFPVSPPGAKQRQFCRVPPKREEAGDAAWLWRWRHTALGGRQASSPSNSRAGSRARSLGRAGESPGQTKDPTQQQSGREGGPCSTRASAWLLPALRAAAAAGSVCQRPAQRAAAHPRRPCSRAGAAVQPQPGGGPPALTGGNHVGLRKWRSRGCSGSSHEGPRGRADGQGEGGKGG